MPIQRLKEFLDRERVPYQIIDHPLAYTAQETAAAAHVSGQELAKTVVVKLDGRMAMVVLPAAHKVNLEQLKRATGAHSVQLATEEEFATRFPECDLGAMPPFGNLYGMDTYVEDDLTEDEKIAFNAGSHTELIQLNYSDFERLAHPEVLYPTARDEYR